MEKTEIQGIYKKSEGIFINKDTDSLQAYRKRKLREKRIDEIQNDFASLKDDIQEIKQLLRGLLR